MPKNTTLSHMKLSKRWEPFGVSIFSTMSQRANQLQAINLAQGFPDFDGPNAIKQAAIDAINNGLNQYAPSIGIGPLRQLLAERQKQRYNLAFDPETEVTVFSGATEALLCAITGLLEPGDEIIGLEPFYDSYPACALMAQAKFRSIPLSPPNWRLDVDRLAANIRPETRAFLINTPHNPTGMMLNADERQAIANLAVRHNLLVITDEVYEELVFTGEHVPLACLPGMRERTVTISSTSKTFSMTGWKIGFAFGPPALTSRLRAVHQFTVFCSATPLQAGMVAALKLEESYFQSYRRDYRQRLDCLQDQLTRAGFKTNTPDGTYFIMADYSAHSQQTDLEFANALVEHAGVAAIPISPFCQHKEVAAKWRYLRFAFCKDTATIRAAGQRLCDWLLI